MLSKTFDYRRYLKRAGHIFQFPSQYVVCAKQFYGFIARNGNLVLIGIKKIPVTGQQLHTKHIDEG